METKRLNLVDMAWLNVETENAPMQVGGLLTFQIPDGAPKDLPRRIVEHYHQFSQAYSPWNHRLRPGALRTVAPEWELLDEIDVEYHFRHSALPAPGGERELGELASRLHSHPLDFRRPPWEAHLIEGLEGNRFALYIKLHHSLLDGVADLEQTLHLGQIERLEDIRELHLLEVTAHRNGLLRAGFSGHLRSAVGSGSFEQEFNLLAVQDLLGITHE